ncbi:hypothetical protein COU77_01235 [Candidatus Peregrinibacteria bacterium CG10_big_fil_rev_8_21_14_0_10_49_16]|nr:MAG: hypothetical protein COU77_01235 [Candidatus Peregrinibacteria bacterium CG10_big_fil_rev_8_21_14_0_10_49_16]
MGLCSSGDAQCARLLVTRGARRTPHPAVSGLYGDPASCICVTLRQARLPDGQAQGDIGVTEITFSRYPCSMSRDTRNFGLVFLLSVIIVTVAASVPQLLL